ncbi:hypothetical protein L7F22_063892 [Adiantum nelumboides]|nr:hypothetical protein [Adiantum nelumboides]
MLVCVPMGLRGAALSLPLSAPARRCEAQLSLSLSLSLSLCQLPAPALTSSVQRAFEAAPPGNSSASPSQLVPATQCHRSCLEGAHRLGLQRFKAASASRRRLPSPAGFGHGSCGHPCQDSIVQALPNPRLACSAVLILSPPAWNGFPALFIFAAAASDHPEPVGLRVQAALWCAPHEPLPWPSFPTEMTTMSPSSAADGPAPLVLCPPNFSAIIYRFPRRRHTPPSGPC